MKVDYDVLEYLRRREKKDMLLIERLLLKLELRLLRKDNSLEDYKRIEHYQGPDLNNTDYYEYGKRYQAYQDGLRDFYKEHGEGVGLDPFTDRVIHDSMEKERELKLVRE